MVHNGHRAIRELFDKNVVPSYGRFELVLSHGAGSQVYDIAGRRYLDLGSGIAVSCLGHAHPAITDALVEQSKKLIHVSNLSPNRRAGSPPNSSSALAAARFSFATAARRRTRDFTSWCENSAMTKAGSKS